jgi:hypothetical protein
VSLPSGATLADLPLNGAPNPATPGEQAVAISDDGTEVAFSSAAGLDVYREGEVVYRNASLGDASTLRFAPNGHTLFVDRSGKLTAIRRGAVDVPPPDARYDPVPPPGFRAAAWNGTAFVRNASGEQSELSLPFLAAWYANRAGSTDVLVFIEQSSEFEEASDLEEWGRMVARGHREHFDPDHRTPEDFEYRTWLDDRGRRTLEMAVRIDDGCDPRDEYQHYTSDGPILYHLDLRVPIETPRKRVAPLRKAFFDTPFGARVPYTRAAPRYLGGDEPC